jgi:hypothetical protein
MEKKNLNRVHIEKGGKVYQTPFLTDGVNVYPAKVTNQNPISKRQLGLLSAMGKPQTIIKQSNAMKKENCPPYMKANSNPMQPYAVVDAETVAGRRTQARLETQGRQYVKKTIKVSLNNTTGSMVTVPIFDGIGLVTDGLSIPSVPAGVTVGGSHGNKTLAVLRALSASNTVPRLTSAHLEADAATFYTSDGKFKTAEGQFNGDTPHVVNYDLAQLVSGSTFNDKIREIPDFRFLPSALNAVLVDVPAGRTITISFYVTAVSETFGMNQV